MFQHSVKLHSENSSSIFVSRTKCSNYTLTCQIHLKKKEERGREMPKKLLFATKQLHRNLHKATESNHFKLKSVELEAFSCHFQCNNESLHKTYDMAVAHEQPLRRELCSQGSAQTAHSRHCHTGCIICSGYSSKGRLNKAQMARQTTTHL